MQRDGRGCCSLRCCSITWSSVLAILLVLALFTPWYFRVDTSNDDSVASCQRWRLRSWRVVYCDSNCEDDLRFVCIGGSGVQSWRGDDCFTLNNGTIVRAPCTQQAHVYDAAVGLFAPSSILGVAGACLFCTVLCADEYTARRKRYRRRARVSLTLLVLSWLLCLVAVAVFASQLPDAISDDGPGVGMCDIGPCTRFAGHTSTGPGNTTIVWGGFGWTIAALSILVYLVVVMMAVAWLGSVRGAGRRGPDSEEGADEGIDTLYQPAAPFMEDQALEHPGYVFTEYQPVEPYFTGRPRPYDDEYHTDT